MQQMNSPSHRESIIPKCDSGDIQIEQSLHDFECFETGDLSRCLSYLIAKGYSERDVRRVYQQIRTSER
jgi:hypothetical protein